MKTIKTIKEFNNNLNNIIESMLKNNEYTKEFKIKSMNKH